MLMVSKGFCAIALMAGAAMASATQPAQVGLDGQYQALRVEAQQSFYCREVQATIRYQHVRRPLESVGRDPEQALGAELLGFRVTKREISKVDRRAIEALFRSLAWVETVDADCYQDLVTVSVRGMLLQEWAQLVTRNLEERPRSRVWTITVDGNGAVKIR
jgi:hypothetical protein